MKLEIIHTTENPYEVIALKSLLEGRFKKAPVKITETLWSDDPEMIVIKRLYLIKAPKERAEEIEQFIKENKDLINSVTKTLERIFKNMNPLKLAEIKVKNEP